MTPVPEYRNCPHCNASFIFPNNKRKKTYCSDECCKAASAARHGVKRYTGILDTGTVGAMNELRVCADLMRRGFDVYRAQAPRSKADLVIVRDCKCYLVAVKTAQRSVYTGKIWVPREQNRHDIFAMAFPDEIVYHDEKGNEIDFNNLERTASDEKFD